MDDADKVRRKRLEKLGGNSSSPSVSSAASSVSNDIAPVRTESPASSYKVQDEIEQKPSNGVVKSDADSISTTTSPTNAHLSAPVQAPTPSPVSFEDWQNQFLKSSLGVTLEENDQSHLIYLSSLVEEVQDETASLKLSVDLLDRLFWARLTDNASNQQTNAFHYLFKVWNTALPKRVIKSDSLADEKNAAKAEVRKRAVDFAVICATSDLTDAGSNTIDLSEILLSSSYDYGRLYEFVSNMLVYADESEILLDLLNQLLHNLGTSLKSKGYSDYKSHFMVVENLLSIPLVTKNLARLDCFSISDDDTSLTPISVLSLTFLGPFLTISPLDGAAVLINYPNADSMSQTQINQVAQDTVAELSVIQGRLFEICHRVVRASPDSRKVLLQYFGKVLDLNHKRTALHVEPNTVSPDGFMLNITYVLTKLCQPFSDLYGAKIDKIDFEYFRRGSYALYDISDETKIAADSNSSQEYLNDRLDGPDPNFISHLFFLTIAYFQYGLNGSIQSQSRVKQITDQLEANIARLAMEMARWRNTPREAMINTTAERLKKQRTQALALKYSLDAVLRSEKFITTYAEFAIFHLMVMVRAAEPKHLFPYKGQYSELQMPFDSDGAPAYFQNYPEFFIEAPVSLLIDIGKYLPLVMMTLPNRPLVIFAVTFLRNSSYVKNPYLKSKLVELLFFGSIDLSNGRKGYFVETYDTEQVCTSHLLHALMNWYIDVEQTGRSSQFYEKFNTRYYISVIIRVIWANNVYRKNLEKESTEDVKFFVQFVALLLNDSTYLLDESLAKLVEIHKLQKELAPLGRPNPAEDQATQEKRQNLASSEKQASSSLQLANQTVHLLKLFTSAVAKAFVTPEIVDRLAAMLNYNVAALVGPKCRELKVQNPEKYGFNPRDLLSQLVEVYVNLDKEEMFVRAVARDGRSFHLGNFIRVKDILSRWGLKSPQVLDEFIDFAKRADVVKEEDEQGDLELGDIPDEYLDPLMYTLMEEPVTLPSSKVNIDLGTIKQHLLSDAKDPFNREPLTIEEVIPNLELKQEIEEFKQRKRKEAREKRQAAAELESASMEVDGE